MNRPISERNYLHLFNCLNAVLPSSLFFGWRRRVLRSAGVAIGDGVRINTRVSFYFHNIEIGAETWVGPECQFHSTIDAGIRIGSRCDIAPAAMFATGSHRVGDGRRRAGPGISTPINLGDGCWIGTRAIILGGAEIGTGCLVAAGAVVLPGKYPANSLLAGVPACIKRELPP